MAAADRRADREPIVKPGKVARAIAAGSVRGGIEPFLVMEIVRHAAQMEAAGRSIIHMEIGQPGTPAPAAAREAVRARLDVANLGYTEALGIPELRERIARHTNESYGVAVSPRRVIVTSGSSAAFVLSFLALFDAGEAVGLPSPGYPCYRHVMSALDLKPELLVTGPEDRWMPTPAEVAERADAANLKGLLLASPANPTGTMLEPERLKAILKVCADKGLQFISDEIYHGLTFGLPARSALNFSDDAIVINSFSKYFSMTGWRIGWMIVPDALVRVIERLQQNLFICPPAVAQVAALGAFDGREELEANRRVYQKNRDLLLAGLPAVGFDRLVPADGAFYVYADVSEKTSDSLAFCEAMLNETGIAATPGVDFDAARGKRFIRFSYAGPTPAMEEALDRLRRWPRLNG